MLSPTIIKPIDKFIPIETLLENYKNQFSHDTTIVKKKEPTRQQANTIADKYMHLWFKKNINSCLFLGIAETIAQEFLRFMIPEQPKTRLTQENQTYYVLSKNAPEFNELFNLSKPALTFKAQNNELPGLGELAVLCLIIGEIDLKLANIGLSNGRVIKIDGGCCFSVPFFRYAFLTTQDIENLPNCPTPLTSSIRDFNWLDTRYDKAERPAYFSAELQQNTNFRHEVNLALLKICTLTPQILKKFTTAYIPEENATYSFFYQYLTITTTRLQKLARQIPSFRSFILSHETNKLFEQHLNNLANFCSTQKLRLIDSSDISQTQKKFTELRTELSGQTAVAAITFPQRAISPVLTPALYSPSVSSPCFFSQSTPPELTKTQRRGMMVLTELSDSFQEKSPPAS